MNLSPIETFLEKNFKGVEHRESKKIYCAHLVRRDKIAAIYYFDYSGDVAEDGFDLAAFQEANISSDYYKLNSSLQWNLNLVFVITREQNHALQSSSKKAQIEADRLFCRKQFCAVDELDTLFPVSTNPVFQETSSGDSDLVVRWAQRLIPAGLGEVLTEATIAQVVRRIIEPPAKPEVAAQELSARDIDDPAGEAVSLDQITIERYRRKPSARSYPLGDANLLRGPNGVGKTSFLEAIELCLCGKTFRSGVEAETSITYMVRGSTEPLKAVEDNRLSQSRDLRWYNNRYSRGNYLPQGFNRFNFYDTDQAYRLAHKTDPNDIRKAFNSLALGERAIFFDERIREVRRRLKDELTKLEGAFSELEELIRDDKAEIAQLNQGLQKPEPHLEILGKELRNLSWHGPAFDGTESCLPHVEGALVEARARLQSTLAILGPWMQPVSLNALKRHHHKLGEILARLDTLEPELESSSLKVSEDAEHIANKLEILGQLQQAKAYAAAGDWAKLMGLGDRVAKIGAELKRLDRINQLLASADLVRLRSVSKSVESYLHDLSQESAALQSEQDRVTVAIGSAKAVLDQLGQLTATLRQTGIEIIQRTTHESECPLCHARYEAGELRHRIEASETGSVDAALDELVRRRTQISASLEESNRSLADAKNLQSALLELTSKAAKKDTPVATVILELENLKETRSNLLRQWGEDSALQTSLEAKGLPEQQLVEIGERLAIAIKGFDIRQQTVETLDQLSGRLGEEVRQMRGESARIKEQQLVMERGFIAECAGYHSLTNSLSMVIATIRTRAEECRLSLVDVSEVERLIPVKDDISLGDLLSALDRILGYISELKRLRAEVETRNKAVQLRTQAVEKASAELQIRATPITRIKKALEPLDYIVKHDSQETALETFFLSYKDMILQIFRAIHSPREFDDISISESEVTLRTLSGGIVRLNQISTGQRAALAISIFLALNTSLQHGPSMILIDDPVANVDDINCVAFLDFLREFVVLRNRQLFFATANSKLANLFSKKFDFLGDKMMTVELAN